MTTVYILSGPPGSGKSTWARQKRKESDVYCLLFESDAYRLNMFGTLESRVQNQKLNTQVFARMREDLLLYVGRAKSEGTDMNLIYDATNISRRRRIALYNEIKSKDKDAKVVVVVFYKFLKELLEINNNREEFEQVPIVKIKEMYVNMQPPRVGVDCDEFELVGDRILIDNGDGTHVARPEFLNEIIGYFDNEPHDSPHHKETIRQHINMCIEASNHDWLLEGVARFHDLGKFVAKTWDDRGFYTYKGHANLSSMYHFNYMYEGIKNGSGHRAVNEAILRHMDAHQGIGEKSIKRHKIDDMTLNLIESFRVIDQKSKIV